MEIGTKDLPVILQGSVGTLEGWIEGNNLVAQGAARDFVEFPSVSSARMLVAAADPVIHVYMAAAEKLVPGLGPTIGAALHLDLAGVCASRWIGVTTSIETDVALGLGAYVRDFLIQQVRATDDSPQCSIVSIEPPPTGKRLQLSATALWYVSTAGHAQWGGEQRELNYQIKLEELQTTLALRTSDLAKLLDVSREAVRQWMTGSPISTDHWSTIDRLHEVQSQLKQYFRLEAIPGLVRRPIPAFNGLTPLQLLAAGREGELVARYRRVFEGGVTQ